MKTMKRIVACLLAVGMVLALVACGGSEQTVTLKMEQSAGGMDMTYTMTLTAKGDEVQKLKAEVNMDLEEALGEYADLLDEDAINEMLNQQLEAVKGEYEVSGADVSAKIDGTAIIVSVDVDCTGANRKDALDLFDLDDNISLKAIQSELEAQGFEVVK